VAAIPEGRRPKFSARRHAAICATAQYFDYTYRQVGGQAPLMMPKTIDHSTVDWALKRIREPYRQRGVAEAVFGGIENRYGATIRCKLSATKVAGVMLMAVAHNLRTYARARATKRLAVFYLAWIY